MSRLIKDIVLYIGWAHWSLFIHMAFSLRWVEWGQRKKLKGLKQGETQLLQSLSEVLKYTVGLKVAQQHLLHVGAK